MLPELLEWPEVVVMSQTWAVYWQIHDCTVLEWHQTPTNVLTLRMQQMQSNAKRAPADHPSEFNVKFAYGLPREPCKPPMQLPHSLPRGSLSLSKHSSNS